MFRPGFLAVNRRRAPSPPVPTGAHRYWRLFFNGVSSGVNVAIAEVEFLKYRFYERATGTYAASGAPNPSQPLSAASDGTYTRSTSSDWWGSNNAPADIWISLDAGAGNEFALEGFTLAGGNLLPAWTTIDVQWSDDNSTWTTEWTETEFAEYAAQNGGTSGAYTNTARPVSWTNPNIAEFTPVAGFNKDGIILWLKSDDGAFSDNLTTPAVDGDPVQTMTNHAVGSTELIRQSTLANRPIFRTGGLAGMPYIDCDPANAQFFEDFAVSLASGSTNITRYRFGALVDITDIQNGDELPILGNTASRKNEFMFRKYATGPFRINGLDYSVLANRVENYGPTVAAVGGGQWANWSLYVENDFQTFHEFEGGGATVPSTAVTSSQLLRNTFVSAAPSGGYFRGKVYEIIYAVDNSKTNEFGQVQGYHIAQYLLGRRLLGAGPAPIPPSYFLINPEGDRLNLGDSGKLLTK